MKRTLAIFGMATTALSAALFAQEKERPLAVGVMAPNFTLSGATSAGVLPKPVTLSDYRGQTVVLAFFPKARTGGCTAQMDAYRDQYAKVFHGGQGVKVFAISVDADTTQASWAKDKGYPVTFLSDSKAEVVHQYGVAMQTKIGVLASRVLYVVDANGKIARVMAPFRETDPAAYTELASSIDQVHGGH